ncbi:DUF937 domain-containing protein [Mangrovicella endophytica]|uniref:DUF937 domain-containing protein n=1 Tax=Mangrovicella endophytica TaxID=2066697 RepID=UPI0012FFF2FA|nr:DUF937 domain-containing protein [Mangrovicella endophytica]
MTDYFDWLAASESGAAIERLGEQFRLSHEELRRATDALVPAFVLAMQRAFSDPNGWAEMAGQFPTFIPMRAGATPDSSTEPARQFLRHVFGSAALINAVARQASVASGIAPDTIEKLMTPLGAMTLDVMTRMVLAGMTRQQSPLAAGDYNSAVAELMRRGANAVEAMGRPSGGPEVTGRKQQAGAATYLEQVFADALKGESPWLPFLSAGAADATRRAASDQRPQDFFTAFTGLFDTFMRAPAAPPASTSTGASSGASRADDAGRTSPAGTGEPAVPPFPQGLANDYARDMMALFERYYAAGKESSDKAGA